MPKPNLRYQTLPEWDEIVAARHSEFANGNMPEYEYRIDLHKLGFGNDEIEVAVATHKPSKGKVYPTTGFVSGLPDN